MLGKFGSEERIRKIHADITPLGEAEGIRFDFDVITVSPNTLDAHRLIRWAATGDRGTQSKLVTTLFSYYFEQGKDIGAHPVLLDAARESGMDVAIAEALLPTDTDRDAVQTEIATAARMGVSGVPCFLLERKYAVMGAQAAETLVDAIKQVAAEKAKLAS
jgi:predicted DsbA family dithiol-disulfide isomerase